MVGTIRMVSEVVATAWHTWDRVPIGHWGFSSMVLDPKGGEQGCSMGEKAVVEVRAQRGRTSVRRAVGAVATQGQSPRRGSE